jgi:hypothetical protein
MATQADFIKQLTIIWIALMAGLAMTAILIFFVVMPVTTSEPIDATVFYFIAIALSAAGMVGSNFMYQVQVRNAAQLVNPIPERLMNQYQTAILIKLALLEGPGIFSVVAALITQQTLFAALTIGILVLMVIAKPSEQQFRTDFLKS